MKKGEQKEKKKLPKWVHIVLLSGALVAIVAESIIFAGSLAGWFEEVPKVEISSEYSCSASEAEEFINLTPEDYENLVGEEKSFVIFVDQDGCTTADGLRERIIEYAKANGIKINRIMFSDMKETSLGDKIKYYPSVAIVSEGEPVVWLRSDSDEDADVYNNYDALVAWFEKYLN